MNVSDEDWREAKKLGQIIREKLLEIMDLQADIDSILRDKSQTPFGSKHWQYACMEALQRCVALTAIQFVLFEPVDRVSGNDELKIAADKIIEIIIAQLKTLNTRSFSRAALLGFHLGFRLICNSRIHGRLQGVTDDTSPDPFPGATIG